MKVSHSKPTEKQDAKEKKEMHFKLELRGEEGHLDYNGSLNEISARTASMMLQVRELASILIHAVDLFLTKVENENKPKNPNKQ